MNNKGSILGAVITGIIICVVIVVSYQTYQAYKHPVLSANVRGAADYFVTDEANLKTKEQTYTVQRVIDCKTIVVTTPEGTSETVRLIGIDALRTRENDKARHDARRIGQDIEAINKRGNEATRFVKKLIDQKEVFLVYDVQKRDKHRRLLAYIFMFEPQVPKSILRDWAIGYREEWIEKGIFAQPAPRSGFDLNVNAFVILNGYAQPMTIPPNVKYADLFQELYEEARENKRGLWNEKSSNKYLASSSYCQKNEDCSIREGACGPEPMNVYFDNSQLIEMQPYVECSDYIPLKNPKCLNNKCAAKSEIIQ